MIYTDIIVTKVPGLHYDLLWCLVIYQFEQIYNDKHPSSWYHTQYLLISSPMCSAYPSFPFVPPNPWQTLIFMISIVLPFRRSHIWNHAPYLDDLWTFIFHVLQVHNLWPLQCLDSHITKVQLVSVLHNNNLLSCEWHIASIGRKKKIFRRHWGMRDSRK